MKMNWLSNRKRETDLRIFFVCFLNFTLFRINSAQQYKVEDYEDGMETLNKASFFKVYGSERIWIVNFYTKSCHQCELPKWKQFAKELAFFRETLAIAALDCGENFVICKGLKLKGYPALKIFQPKSPVMKEMLTLNGGEDTTIPNNLEELIDKVIAYVPNDQRGKLVNLRKKVEKVFANEKIGSPHNEDPSQKIHEISMKLLIKTVRYSLHNEVGVWHEIEGKQLKVLKNFLQALAHCFPEGNLKFTSFLTNLNNWTKTSEGIDNISFIEKLNEIEKEFGPWNDLEFTSNWGNCEGSIKGLRGYPCGLWTLFHTLTVISYKKGHNYPILDVIHGYVEEYLGCAECTLHFSKIMVNDEALFITPIKDQVLWLWRAHNKINMMLKEDVSEDPAHPKEKYPSISLCPECYGGDGFFDEEIVLQHLVKVYGNPIIKEEEERPTTFTGTFFLYLFKRIVGFLMCIFVSYWFVRANGTA